MKASFSGRANEFDEDFLKFIKSFAKSDDDIVTVTIDDNEEQVLFSESKEDFVKRIQSRIDEYHASEYKEDDSLSMVNDSGK